MKIVFIIAAALAAIILLLGLGLSIRPRPFPVYADAGETPEMVDLPDGLPVPVERFYRQIYGNQVPVIESMVISGRAKMRMNGLRMKGRWRFTHTAGQDYRHYIETTIFGLPLLKVNESYLDGHMRMVLPFGTIGNEPRIDSAANLGLWAETVWLPALFVTDPRVHWEAVDDTTALLYVPYGDEEQTFTVKFDTQSGMLVSLEAMRWRDAADEEEILWVDEVLGWTEVSGYTIPSPASVTWMDQGFPWAVFTIDEIVYNADVSSYVRGTGY